jgi:VanZ family protein
MYFGLTVLVCWAFHAEDKRIRIIYIVLFSVSWGLLMEISQLEMMLGRAFEWKDEMANSVGTLLGVATYLMIARFQRSLNEDEGENVKIGKFGNVKIKE